MSGYTIFITYMLIPDNLVNLINQENDEQNYYSDSISIPIVPTTSNGCGNSKYIYCNYINKLIIDSEQPYLQEVMLTFSDVNEFKFLSDDIESGTGFTANKIYAIIQLVNNANFESLDEVVPSPELWRKVNITNQIASHMVGDLLTAEMLTNQSFKIPLNDYIKYPYFYLNTYLDYSTVTIDNLSFGDETMFFGNVSTSIKSEINTTDIVIQLGLNEYNTTTNPTWNQTEDVLISEVGIYDGDYNLVAIGKFNNPVSKNSSNLKSILFNIDF